MAAELCKVSLWLEAIEPGKPLSFLDHHIVVGNSLLGATAQLIAQGVPDAAFDPIEGDDKELCKILKKRNKEERESKQGNLFDPSAFAGKELLEAWHELEELPEDSLEDIRRKEKTFRGAESALAARKLMADAWCTAFTAPKTPAKPGEPTSGQVITTSTLRRLANGVMPSDEERQLIQDCAQRFQFLHAELAFPGVFAKGGFDVVLGNPPWEQIQFEPKAFFSVLRPDIANAKHTSERDGLIAELKHSNPNQYSVYEMAQRFIDDTQKLISTSGHFPLASYGRLNSAPLFFERGILLAARRGSIAFIVPTGVATDAFNGPLFRSFVKGKRLVSVLDFDNRSGFFQDVQRNVRFAIITLRDSIDGSFTVSTRLESPSQRFDQGRFYNVTPRDLDLLSPETGVCPMIDTAESFQILRTMYTASDLGRSTFVPLKPRIMFMMNSDSDKFVTDESIHTSDANQMAPVYESKFIAQYSYRNGTFDGIEPERRYTTHAGTRKPSANELADPDFHVTPRYWMPSSVVKKRSNGATWLLVYRDVISAIADSRSSVSCIAPLVAAVNTLWIGETQDAFSACLAVSWLNSFSLDYCLRQKTSGGHFSANVLRQLPFPRRAQFRTEHPALGPTPGQFVVSRVCELSYSGNDLEPFAKDLGYNGNPFIWDEDRRFLLKAELDAAFFHLYGLQRDDVDYIMETFPIVKKRDIAVHGSYRTKEAILAIYDEMAQALATGASYQTKLDPPPANGWVPPPLPPLEDYVEPEKDSKPTNSRVAESKVPYQTSSGAALAKAGKPAPNLFEAPVPTLFDEDVEEEAPAPPPAASGKAIINGQPVEVLKIVKLDVTRSQYQVILVSTGEMKSYVSPPAKVQML